MKKALLVIVVLFFASGVWAQKYMSRTGVITFTSKAPMETIEGKNNQVASTLNAATGEITIALLIKSFEFDRALLQEHFNENYMESDKYPRSVFKGKISNLEAVNFKKNGQYQVTIEGQLTIHNVTKAVKEAATVTVSGTKVTAAAKFNIAPAEYGIQIPSLVKDKIAKNVVTVVNIPYELVK
jgi:polyisoprenoid-binding protein YceI